MSQSFYPPQALEQVVQRVASTDLSAFGARWRLPKEVGSLSLCQGLVADRATHEVVHDRL